MNPLALVALVSVAAPILIHILVQRRAERFPFPTLRFLRPTRLAAIRRHVLEDAGLLLIRAAILAAAVAAVAGPLVVTSIRRQAWDRRIVRAIVVDGGAPVEQTGTPAFRSQQFTGTSLRDGIRRAVAWLDKAPPARREIVVVSRLAIGSLDAADIAEVPASIGLRFERRGELPAARTIAAGRVMGTARSAAPRSPTDRSVDPAVVAREVTFAGPRTVVRELPSSGSATWPIDAVHGATANAAVAAAQAAVLDQRVWPPQSGRQVRLVIGIDEDSAPALVGAAAMSQPWMANAAAAIGRDRELQSAALHVAAGIADPRMSARPWQTLASAADGRPLIVAAASANDLIVASGASATDVATPLLMRSLTEGVGSIPDLQEGEVMPIAQAQLDQWSRPAPPPPSPDANTLRHDEVDDDRRWFWTAALCLIGAETWVRRRRRSPADEPEQHEAARVA